MPPIDPVELSRALIRCPSVTPDDAGALDVLQATLEGIGFTCTRLPFSQPGTPDVDNLYARIGSTSPNFCFAGHTDVVPVGDRAAWTSDPFGGDIRDHVLYGRGATDMKCAVACFAAAAAGFLAERGSDFGGSISFLITGDEEGSALNGTLKVLDWMEKAGEIIDSCLVGEPTNPEAVGDMIKIGRRGSLIGYLTVTGTQGHSAYPELADNPIPRLINMLGFLIDTPLDTGTAHFPASSVAVTTIDVGNGATNVIPAKATAVFNIRFNDLHTGESLEAMLRERFDAVGGRFTLKVAISGEAFLTPPGPLSEVISNAVQAATGKTPELSTTGGTSDARFIKDYCPVAEFGLINQTAHKVDENAKVDDIEVLAAIYRDILERTFPRKC